MPLLDVRGLAQAAVAPSVGDPVRFPFVLVPYRGTGYAEGGMRDMAWLCELPLVAGNPWRERVEISEEDARRLGIRNGDTVLVESPMAQVEVHAVVRAGIRAGVLGLSLGAGPVLDAAPGASSLLSSLVDAVTGHWLACATRAHVRKLT
jgi:anaerobic selenocysteine-containing dehydrogenase